MRGPGDLAPGNEPKVKESKEEILADLKKSLNYYIALNQSDVASASPERSALAKRNLGEFQDIRSKLDLL